MTDLDQFTFAPGTVLDGRFEVLGTVEAGAARPVLRCKHLESGTEVHAFGLDASERAVLEPAVTLVHPHVARILAVVEVPRKAPLLVFEAVDGPLLSDKNDVAGQLELLDVVRLVLRVADALAHVEALGGVHPFVSPRALKIDPSQRKRPVLVFAPPLPGELPPPGRVPGSLPAEVDHAWNLASIALLMLSGRPAPASGVSDELLESWGIDDAPFRALLIRALATDARARIPSAAEFRRELTHWFMSHAGGDLTGPQDRTEPPPLPPSLAPPPRPATSRQPKGRGGMRVSIIIAVVVFVAAGAAMFALRLSSVGPSDAELEPVTPGRARSAGAAPSTSTSGSAQALTLDAVEMASDDDHRECVAGWLSATDVGTDRYSWLCAGRSYTEGASKLMEALPNGGDAEKRLEALGWYRMVVVALLQRGCCPSVPTAPAIQPTAACENIVPAVSKLAEALETGTGLPEATEKAHALFRCIIEAGAGSPFGPGPPGDAEREAFTAFATSVTR